MPRRRGLSGGDVDIDIQLAAPTGAGGFASTVDDTVTHAVLIESFRRPGVTMMFGGFLVAVAACLVIGVRCLSTLCFLPWNARPDGHVCSLAWFPHLPPHIAVCIAGGWARSHCIALGQQCPDMRIEPLFDNMERDSGPND